MADTLIDIRNAAFGYAAAPVIRGVTLSIEDGEFVGLIGPNGAGKSTLFKGMLRLIPPMAGSVDHAAKIRNRIGYVPQRDQLDAIYPLTAFDVAMMGPSAAAPWYRVPGRDAKNRVLRCLDSVGMSDRRDRSFAELSGGQRQRVLIARALAMNPEILVLDEPTAGIDPVAEDAILTLLADLNRERRITVLMVSHHIQSLRHRVHRAVLVKDGKVASGSAEEMLHPDRVVALLDE